MPLHASLVAVLVLAASSPPVVEEAALEAPTTRGFGLGAQTELISPDIGISAALLSFDAGRVQYEVSVGLGIFERGANALQATDVYGLGARVYLPVHWTARADFSLGAGVGFTLLDSGGALSRAWTLLAGAKVRIFVVPNAAILGALGAGVFFRDQGNALFVGARPLGSAGFVYYFQ